MTMDFQQEGLKQRPSRQPQSQPAEDTGSSNSADFETELNDSTAAGTHKPLSAEELPLYRELSVDERKAWVMLPPDWRRTFLTLNPEERRDIGTVLAAIAPEHRVDFLALTISERRALALMPAGELRTFFRADLDERKVWLELQLEKLSAPKPMDEVVPEAESHVPVDAPSQKEVGPAVSSSAENEPILRTKTNGIAERSSQLLVPDSSAMPSAAALPAPAFSSTSADVQTSFPEYRILHRVGSGGVTEVFLIQMDDRDPKSLAILKIVNRGIENFRQKESARLRLEYEANRINTLGKKHPALYPSWAVKVNGGIVCERKGEPFEACLEAPNAESFSIDDVRQIAADACDAIHFLGEPYCDAKPKNFVIYRETGRPRLALVDLSGNPIPADRIVSPQSILHSADASLVSALGKGMWTPDVYSAPEQGMSGGTVRTAQVDVFRLGAMLYHVVMGQPPSPFGPEPQGNYAGLKDVFRRSMAPLQSGIRYQSVLELKQAFLQALGGLIVEDQKCAAPAPDKRLKEPKAAAGREIAEPASEGPANPHSLPAALNTPHVNYEDVVDEALLLARRYQDSPQRLVDLIGRAPNAIRSVWCCPDMEAARNNLLEGLASAPDCKPITTMYQYAREWPPCDFGAALSLEKLVSSRLPWGQQIGCFGSHSIVYPQNSEDTRRLIAAIAELPPASPLIRLWTQKLSATLVEEADLCPLIQVAGNQDGGVQSLLVELASNIGTHRPEGAAGILQAVISNPRSYLVDPQGEYYWVNPGIRALEVLRKLAPLVSASFRSEIAHTLRKQNRTFRRKGLFKADLSETIRLLEM